MTIRFDDTVDLLHQLIGCHLASGHLRPKQLVEKLDPVQPCDPGSLTLGDPALVRFTTAGIARVFPGSG